MDHTQDCKKDKADFTPLLMQKKISSKSWSDEFVHKPQFH